VGLGGWGVDERGVRLGSALGPPGTPHASLSYRGGARPPLQWDFPSQIPPYGCIRDGNRSRVGKSAALAAPGLPMIGPPAFAPAPSGPGRVGRF
jgi:hypothetical protein